MSPCNNHADPTQDSHPVAAIDDDSVVADLDSGRRRSSFQSSAGSSQEDDVADSRVPDPPPILPSADITVDEFYHRKSVFITGGTGFVGKVLIEKLLFEFPQLDTVYVMLRPKSGQLIRTRLQELTRCPVFDRIRANFPERLEKLQAISGDIRFPGLGINPLDLQRLVGRVSIVFHIAATIRFDEPLKYALTLNTLGTKRVIQLAKKLQNLQAFVHVSTAYCTVDKRNIEEKVYPEPVEPDRVLEMADFLDDSTLDQLTGTFYRGRPCSYHYTKSLAEHLIAQEVASGYLKMTTTDCFDQDDNDTDSNDERRPTSTTVADQWRPFPGAIVRPSIITPSWRDPFPGWIDNYNGTTGFLVVSGKGVLRSMHVHKDYRCDMVPVDVVINTCILSAWYVATRHYRNKTEPSMFPVADNHQPNVFVVNCVSGPANPITWSQIRDISIPLMFKYPSLEMFRVPGVRYHEYPWLNKLNVYLEHTVPSYVVDFLFKFMGLSPILDQVYQKVHRATTALEFFTTNEWTYRGENMIHLAIESNKSGHAKRNEQLSCHKNDDDCVGSSGRKSTQMDNRFPVDLRRLDWPAYFKDYVLGIRRYLLKEDPATIPQAQNQLFIIYILTLAGKLLVTGTMAYQLLHPDSLARRILTTGGRNTSGKFLRLPASPHHHH